MTEAPRIDSYDWAGGREPMLRFGPEHGPVVVLALPLFEEANRTRAFGVSVLRALAEQGIGGVLPDVPGQGESGVATAMMRLADLRTALAAVPGTHTLAIRSGALLIDARRCWMLAPQSAEELMRDLRRLLNAQEKKDHPEHAQLRRWGSGGLVPCSGGDVTRIAGNLIPNGCWDELSQATLPGESRGPVAQVSAVEGGAPFAGASQLGPGVRRGGIDRTVRLASDPRPADRHVDGPALWRRAEPANDPVLAQKLAADIADWITTCGS